MELDDLDDSSMTEILESQKQEANSAFFKYITKNYASWFDRHSDDAPVLSHQLFKNKILPELKHEQPTLLVVVDNLRYDQLKTIEPIINNHYKKEKEEAFYSILPTATQYARNAIFSGLMPLDMEKLYPNLWLNDTDEGGKNMHEAEFFDNQLKRLGQHLKHTYHKITTLDKGRHLADNFAQYKNDDLTVVVYNFVDMLSHAKTEMQVIKELASNDKSYRSLTKSWFKNSPLLDIIIKAQRLGFQIDFDHRPWHDKRQKSI